MANAALFFSSITSPRPFVTERGQKSGVSMGGASPFKLPTETMRQPQTQRVDGTNAPIQQNRGSNAAVTSTGAVPGVTASDNQQLNNFHQPTAEQFANVFEATVYDPAVITDADAGWITTEQLDQLLRQIALGNIAAASGTFKINFIPAAGATYEFDSSLMGTRVFEELGLFNFGDPTVPVTVTITSPLANAVTIHIGEGVTIGAPVDDVPATVVAAEVALFQVRGSVIFPDPASALLADPSTIVRGASSPSGLLPNVLVFTLGAPDLANPVTIDGYFGTFEIVNNAIIEFVNPTGAFIQSFSVPDTTLSLQAGPLPLVLSKTVINATAVDIVVPAGSASCSTLDCVQVTAGTINIVLEDALTMMRNRFVGPVNISATPGIVVEITDTRIVGDVTYDGGDKYIFSGVELVGSISVAGGGAEPDEMVIADSIIADGGAPLFQVAPAIRLKVTGSRILALTINLTAPETILEGNDILGGDAAQTYFATSLRMIGNIIAQPGSANAIIADTGNFNISGNQFGATFDAGGGNQPNLVAMSGNTADDLITSAANTAVANTGTNAPAANFP